MTKILLARPSHASVRQHFSPPLGILSLAAYLRERLPDTEIKIMDILPEGLTPAAALARILEYAPDLLGLSAMSYEAPDLHALAAAVKRERPELPIIAGGPYPTTAPERALADPGLDFLVCGEGEETALELIPRVLAGSREAPDVAGIGYRKDGAAFLTAPRSAMVDLDALPLPAYDLVDLRRYWDRPRFGTTFVHREYAVLSTSRACPYRCTYCHRIFGAHYRAQKPEVVLRDLETLAAKFGVREIQFVDDCFNLEKKRVAAICEGIRERGLKFAISFPNGIRGDIMDEPTLDQLKSAGAYRITYAVETASPRIQKLVKKNLNLAAVKKIIAATDARGIMVDGFFMVGFPGETRAEIESTFAYALASKLHTANFWFVTPFPGTELFEQAKEMGYTLPAKTESLHYFDPTTDLSEVPATELKRMVQRTFLRFYLNPWRLLRILKLFPNKRQLPALGLRFIKVVLKWDE